MKRALNQNLNSGIVFLSNYGNTKKGRSIFNKIKIEKMKKLTNAGVALMFFGILFSGCSGTRAVAQSPAPSSVTYQTFYDDLSPYGSWIDYSPYGNVWHPTIDGDFRPYLTNGYWDYSEDGWMWMSNYNWGWAPFHYGRWMYDDMYGWMWVPGYEWSPAWVTWGSFGDDYAWAPLMPYVNVGIQFGSYRPNSIYWNVCKRDHIYDRDINREVLRRGRVDIDVNRIKVINNFGSTKIHNQFYSKGPDVHEVQMATKQKITVASIKEVKNTAIPVHSGNEIQVYKPAVVHPLPRQFRQVDNNSPIPAKINSSEARGTNSPEPTKVNTPEPTKVKSPEPARIKSLEPMRTNSAEPMRTNSPEPTRINNDQQNMDRVRQQQNIERMPVRTAPQSTFGARQPNNAGGQRGRRN